MACVPNIILNKLSCKQGAVRAVRFNVDGSYCLTAGSDKSIKLWNPYKAAQLQNYLGHGYEVLDVHASCDSAFIASGGMDKSVFYWDVRNAQIVRRFRGHVGFVNAVMFNEESTVIFSASVDNTVRAWDCRSKSRDPIQILSDAKDAVTSLSVSNHEIVTASLDGKIRRYDLRAGKLFEDNIGCSINCVKFTKDGQCILVSCLNDTLYLVDKDSGTVLSQYMGHENKRYRVESCLSDTDFYIVSGSEDGYVYFWNLIEGTVKEKVHHKGHRVVHSLSFHPSKPILVTAADGDIYLWSTPKNEEEDSN